MPAERGPSGTGHDTAQRCPNSTPHRHHDWIYNGVLCRCPGALPLPDDPPVAVPGPASVSPAEPRMLTGNVAAENNPKLRGEDVVALDAADPVVSPAETREAIERAEEWIGEFRDTWDWPRDPITREVVAATAWTTLDEAASLAEAMTGLAAALLAVGERDRAEIERLADRAVCSGCGSDIYDDAGCTYPTCEFGELIPSSELPLALQASCDKTMEVREERDEEIAELATERERDRRQIARLTEALEQIAAPGPELFQDDGQTRGLLPPSLRGQQRPIFSDTLQSIARAVLAGEEDADNG